MSTSSLVPDELQLLREFLTEVARKYRLEERIDSEDVDSLIFFLESWNKCCIKMKQQAENNDSFRYRLSLKRDLDLIMSYLSRAIGLLLKNKLNLSIHYSNRGEILFSTDGCVYDDNLDFSNVIFGSFVDEMCGKFGNMAMQEGS